MRFFYLCFQLHLKDEDSFIYLNAVQGLASLADSFTDTILEALCEEYSDFTKKDPEIRMKLGEALVRVVKILGEFFKEKFSFSVYLCDLNWLSNKLGRSTEI